MVFRNISAEFLEDTIVLVSAINKSGHIQKSFFKNQEPEQNVNFYYILKNTNTILLINVLVVLWISFKLCTHLIGVFSV